VIERSLFDLRKAGNERCAAWFDEHIFQTRAHQIRITAIASAEHQCQMRALHDELGQLIPAFKRFASAARTSSGSAPLFNAPCRCEWSWRC